MAQAILLKDVEDLGKAGEAVDVSPGYLRNYLQPRKLAQPATAASLEDARRRREAADRAPARLPSGPRRQPRSSRRPCSRSSTARARTESSTAR